MKRVINLLLNGLGPRPDPAFLIDDRLDHAVKLIARRRNSLCIVVHAVKLIARRRNSLCIVVPQCVGQSVECRENAALLNRIDIGAIEHRRAA